MSPTEDIPITLLAASLFGRLCQEQIARMIEERTFVEMPLERTRQETHLVLLHLWFVPLAHEPILLVDDTVIGQDLNGLAPCGMDRLVFRSRYRIEFGQLHLESHRDVGVFGEDAVVLDGQQRKFGFQCRGFKCISHSSVFCG